MPDTLASLTLSPMYPESDATSSVKGTKNNKNILSAKIKRVENHTIDIYYQLTNPSSRVPTSKIPSFIGKNEHNNWRDNCVNKDSITDIPDHNLIPYEEGGKIYCLDIHATMTEGLFNDDEDIVNPSTGKIIRPEFLAMMRTTFANWGNKKSVVKDTSDEEDLPKVEEIGTVPLEEMISSGLLQMVIDNITELEI